VLRFAVHYDEPAGRALYLGAFHAVSAFNNAGFTLFTTNLIGFATDPWICGPLAVATLVGGVGFPVLFELGRRLRGGSRRWSLHLKITVGTYAVLLRSASRRS
jgi:trk system potassium uptake protein